MNSNKCILLFFVVLSTTLISCKQKPFGFWGNFNEKYIIDYVNDELPDEGGAWSIDWSSGKKGTFTEKQMLDFAILNNWQPIDTLQLSKSDMSEWVSNGSPLFTIYFDGIHMIRRNADDRIYADFDRMITDNLTLYRFNTNLPLTSSGVKSYDNGYILVSDDGREMSLYYFVSQ